jgi:acyl-CoA thioesterase FadM
MDYKGEPMAKLEITLPEKFPFNTDISVRETDLAQLSLPSGKLTYHVPYDVVFKYFREAFAQFLISLGFSESNIAGASMILPNYAFTYEKEIKRGDKLKAWVVPSNFSTKGCEIYLKITNSESEIVARAKFSMLFYDYEKGNTLPVPQDFLKSVKV